MTVRLRLDGVTLQYTDGAPPALDGVTLEVAGGEVVWLFGRLGAGCSSVLQAAAGVTPRYTGGAIQGTVTTLGVTPGEPGAWATLAGRVAYVTPTPAAQLSGIAPAVWEEVGFAPANLGWPLERIRSAVAEALARFDITALSDRDPATLSGGELQRVVLASMLVLAPELWLLDEPASALDRSGRHLLHDVLCREAARGAAVLVATEDADAMLEVATRVVVLDAGRVVLTGAPRAVLAGEDIWQHAAGSTSVAALARSAGALCLPAPAALAAPYPLDIAEGLARWR